ncbi:MAG: ABC transporter ATP-binding protein/permease [Zoogloeaceae bacterium]|jgi:ABC-type multidrug transport system fused ATPase/permease subunit|nr:ABC transporter ATP-binding protein/permease [Zoogloeaceae bacterium]
MMNILKKVWYLFTPSEQKKAVWIVVLCVLMAILETVGVISIAPFLMVLVNPDIIQKQAMLLTIYQYFGFDSPKDFIFALGFFSIVVVIASSAFKTITLHLVNRFVHFERHSISMRLMERYLKQTYEFFLTSNPSLLAKKLLSETDALLINVFIPLSQLLAQGIVVLAVVSLIVWFDPVMALCIIAVVGILYGIIYRLARKHLARIGREWQVADSQRHQACSEVFGGIKDVKINRLAISYQQKYGQASYMYSRHAAANDTLSQSPLYIVEATGYSGLILIAMWLLFKMHDLTYVLPTLGLYGFAAYRMLPSVQIMYRGFSRLRFSLASINIIGDDLMLSETSSAIPTDPLIPQHEIRLEQVRYAYPSSPDALILDGFDLVIKANSCVGIVGKSGSGKSTLMDILLGLLRLQGGALYIDDVMITEANVSAWQYAIGYVPQQIFLSDASVLENIAFGIPVAKIDRDAVERAARVSHIHDFIMKELPQGYDTVTGDRGIRLSGGQRQRIGIARALYRDPPVLFMDEATSALDAQTEEAVNEAIRTLSGSKTIVVVAHKSSALQHCQQIIVLNKIFMTTHIKEIKHGM